MQSTSFFSSIRLMRLVDMDFAEQKINCCFTVLPEEKTLVCRDVLILHNISQGSPTCYCARLALGQPKSQLTSLWSEASPRRPCILVGSIQGHCSLSDLPVLMLFFKYFQKGYYVAQLVVIYSFSPSLQNYNFVQFAKCTISMDNLHLLLSQPW